MRIEFVGVGHPMQIAKSMKRALAARGTEIGLRKCEEVFAKMCGYANWHELRKVCLPLSAGFVRDEEAGEVVAAARRHQFTVKLSELTRVSLSIAEGVVDQVRPTGKRVKPQACEVPSSPSIGR